MKSILLFIFILVCTFSNAQIKNTFFGKQSILEIGVMSHTNFFNRSQFLKIYLDEQVPISSIPLMSNQFYINYLKQYDDYYALGVQSKIGFYKLYFPVESYDYLRSRQNSQTGQNQFGNYYLEIENPKYKTISILPTLTYTIGGISKPFGPYLQIGIGPNFHFLGYKDNLTIYSNYNTSQDIFNVALEKKGNVKVGLMACLGYGTRIPITQNLAINANLNFTFNNIFGLKRQWYTYNGNSQTVSYFTSDDFKQSVYTDIRREMLRRAMTLNIGLCYSF